MGTSIFLKNKSNVIKFQDSAEYIGPANLDENILTSIFIPANSILNNSSIEMYFNALSQNLNANKRFAVYINNTNDLIGAKLIALFISNNNLYQILRQYWYFNNLLSQYRTSWDTLQNNNFGISNATTFSNFIDFSTDNYLIITAQLSNIADIVTLRNITMIVTN